MLGRLRAVGAGRTVHHLERMKILARVVGVYAQPICTAAVRRTSRRDERGVPRLVTAVRSRCTGFRPADRVENLNRECSGWPDGLPRPGVHAVRLDYCGTRTSFTRAGATCRLTRFEHPGLPTCHVGERPAPIDQLLLAHLKVPSNKTPVVGRSAVPTCRWCDLPWKTISCPVFVEVESDNRAV